MTNLLNPRATGKMHAIACRLLYLPDNESYGVATPRGTFVFTRRNDCIELHRHHHEVKTAPLTVPGIIELLKEGLYQ